MSVGGEAAVLPQPRQPVVARVAVRPIRHVRQAAGRYVTFALVRWNYIDSFL